MDQLLGHSITYRIAVGPRAGRKVFTLQKLPACDPAEAIADTVRIPRSKLDSDSGLQLYSSGPPPESSSEV